MHTEGTSRMPGTENQQPSPYVQDGQQPTEPVAFTGSGALGTDPIETPAGSASPKRWISDEKLQAWFSYHPATPFTGAAHDAWRDSVRVLAEFANEFLPEGPEKTTTINKLREVMFWGNHMIATTPDHDYDVHPAEHAVTTYSSRPDPR